VKCFDICYTVGAYRLELVYNSINIYGCFMHVLMKFEHKYLHKHFISTISLSKLHATILFYFHFSIG
jgi:hypothetical protein